MTTAATAIKALCTTGQPYIPLQDGPRFDFEWSPAVVRELVRMWQAGICLSIMAETVQRDPDELAVLIIDLRRRNIIKDRPGGAWGKVGLNGSL